MKAWSCFEVVSANKALWLGINEREEAERLLRESEHRYRSLNDNIPVDVFRSEPGGKIISFNSAMFHILDIPKDQDITEINANDLYQRQEDRRWWVDDISHGRQVRGFECQLKGFSGDSIWASISASGIEDDKGNITFIDGMVEDITTRKTVEQDKDMLQKQLLQMQKLEAIGTLDGVIAHDFNDILGGIIGYSELALAETGREEKTFKNISPVSWRPATARAI